MEKAQIHLGTTEPLSEFELLRHEMLEGDIEGQPTKSVLNRTVNDDKGIDFDDAADDFGAMEDLPSRVLDDNFVNEPYQIPTQGTVFGSLNTNSNQLTLRNFDTHSDNEHLSAYSESNRSLFDFSEHFWKIVSNYKQLKGKLIRGAAHCSEKTRSKTKTSTRRN